MLVAGREFTVENKADFTKTQQGGTHLQANLQEVILWKQLNKHLRIWTQGGMAKQALFNC